MRNRTMRLGVSIVFVLSMLAGIQSALANWTTNGPGSFTAGSGLSIWQFVNTSGTQSGFRCFSNTGTGTLNGPSLPTSTLGTFTVQNAGCTVVGLGFSVSCDAAQLDGLSYAAPTTTGALTGFSCHIAGGGCGNATTYQGAITVTGTAPFSYGNTSQQLALPPSGQNLSATGPNCFIKVPATVHLVNSSGTALVYGMTSTFRPNITN
jgi:hypothetical protein